MRRSGFTLVELLIVIAIIGVMMGLLLPAVQKTREAANRIKCKNNLRQIGLALHAYHDRAGSLPPGYWSRVARDGSDLGPGWGWAAFILPELEQDNLYRSIRFDLDIADPANEPARLTPLAVFRCPSDELVDSFPVVNAVGQPITTVAHGNYVGMFGTPEITCNPGKGNGVFYRNSRVRLTDITDGTSNTLMIGERSSNLALATWTGAVTGGVVPPARPSPLGPEGAPVLVLGHTGLASEGHTPNNPINHVDDFWSRHTSGVNFLFADCSVRNLNDAINPLVWQAMGTRDGGEPFTEDR
jgi:prepilin-type N-terminal cleavage/methylation domain-containing protein/prepilin-type processing-associated H-X9-DG protein